MLLTAHLHIETNAAARTPCILMLHPQSGAGQSILENKLHTSTPCTFHEYTDYYGNICLRTTIPPGPFRLDNYVLADCSEYIDVHPTAPFVPMEDIPDQVVPFILPSRYCEADLLGGVAREIIGSSAPGYPQVEAIRQWIHDNFRYAYGVTNISSSAKDLLNSRIGVCRDYAHTGIALCRSLDIPARMVVGYLYQLEPMDMHAWFEAFVGGRWYTFDATQDLPRANRIVIAYGKDAADVAIATYFEDIGLTRLQVDVQAK
ncbi:MAG: transglutaminase family protein [Bacteroidetes bacterium]|nr:transglutaminase family protein [Bacteroidota bacterium]